MQFPWNFTIWNPESLSFKSWKVHLDIKYWLRYGWWESKVKAGAFIWHNTVDGLLPAVHLTCQLDKLLWGSSLLGDDWWLMFHNLDLKLEISTQGEAMYKIGKKLRTFGLHFRQYIMEVETNFPWSQEIARWNFAYSCLCTSDSCWPRPEMTCVNLA